MPIGDMVLPDVRKVDMIATMFSLPYAHHGLQCLRFPSSRSVWKGGGDVLSRLIEDAKRPDLMGTGEK